MLVCIMKVNVYHFYIFYVVCTVLMFLPPIIYKKTCSPTNETNNLMFVKLCCGAC